VISRVVHCWSVILKPVLPLVLLLLETCRYLYNELPCDCSAVVIIDAYSKMVRHWSVAHLRLLSHIGSKQLSFLVWAGELISSEWDLPLITCDMIYEDVICAHYKHWDLCYQDRSCLSPLYYNRIVYQFVFTFFLVYFFLTMTLNCVIFKCSFWDKRSSSITGLIIPCHVFIIIYIICIVKSS